ncbi:MULTISPECIES: hypothetical protein [unclassified Streptococcus]|uniref:hypothetical protein n=1 Tax=unclassified Streptococcus TaxID=2608887 RepID=UPI0018AAF954|nr:MULTISPECIES: hypothetical protein [unclassified Streptococcus]MBF8969822.1 hypothetical protein [Streptococcus sp. NLN76]MBJ6745194.1 hypothetical protein [Streptococcus sp. 121]
MATKSFTTDLIFTRDSADSLLTALSAKSDIKFQGPTNVEVVTNPKTIKEMFKKG